MPKRKRSSPKLGNSPVSVLTTLLETIGNLRYQIYFKSSLTALSHAMEDQVLSRADSPLVIANFQKEKFYQQESHRYGRMGSLSDQVYVLASPETDFANGWKGYETIAFNHNDPLAQEWHLVIISEGYSYCLICREKHNSTKETSTTKQNSNNPDCPLLPVAEVDSARTFEGIWTFDREVTVSAANILLNQVLYYRPELEYKVKEARAKYLGSSSNTQRDLDPNPFVQRLLTYLQAGQYKLQKAYRSLFAREQKERLLNAITGAIRHSLNTDEILETAINLFGPACSNSRCLLYKCRSTDISTVINHEFLNEPIESLVGKSWLLKDNPMFQAVSQQRTPVYMIRTSSSIEVQFINLNDQKLLKLLELSDNWQIRAWLMVPIFYQDRLLGILELHNTESKSWEKSELELVEAIATQVGVALIQAESYANLEDLNEQLEALDRTRSNLVAITGHELRTPLSTIQVCLESLASEPDMSPELRQIMLQIAMADAERMRKLIKDFLTLSRLESGNVEWHPEDLSLSECVNLSLCNIRNHKSNDSDNPIPEIKLEVPTDLPLVKVDGEGLVEVLNKLIDNACKFTLPNGQVVIQAKSNGSQMLRVTIADTGRGIEPNRLEVVFDRFYQEEGALQRTKGGTGLGLAICRQIVTGWGGQIWAESEGKDQGTQFHFTIPIVN